MRFATVFALAGAVASVSASTLSRRQANVPTCAGPCLMNAEAPFGDCAPTDNACLCRNEEFVAFGIQCVTEACTDPAEREAAFAFSRELCEVVGVTITSQPAGEPTASGEPAPSGAPSGSGSGSGSAPGSVRPTGSSSGTPPSTSEPADEGSASNTRVSVFAAALGLAALLL